jgi:predicted transcriptional regulator
MNAAERPFKPTTSCMVHDHLQQAVKIMCENDCGTVPVLNADGHLVGSITARDICIAAYRQCRPLWHMDVGSVMSRPKGVGTDLAHSRARFRWIAWRALRASG